MAALNADVPIIAPTARAMVSDREECFAAGCAEFETKPIELGRLVEKMQSLLGAVSRP